MEFCSAYRSIPCSHTEDLFLEVHGDVARQILKTPPCCPANSAEHDQYLVNNGGPSGIMNVCICQGGGHKNHIHPSPTDK